jgi:peptidase M1-like protein
MPDRRSRGYGRLLVPLVVVAAGVPATTAAAPATSSPASAPAKCSAGAHTLAEPGSIVYPDMGNGGYASVHSDVTIRYDEPSNTFLPGTHVLLSDRATQCLTSFSLDFERREPGTPNGPDLTVHRILVNGVPASYRFVQPTYPGDPKGQTDPDPRAHEVSQDNPVGGPHDNPLPPACSPELTSGAIRYRHSQDGQQCPANKLVITPRNPIPDGTTFAVRVDYTGRPGLHHDADGSNEGWFRVRGGDSTVTEPVGSEDWMPLNNFPTAKPTYNFLITTNAGKTAICNGKLMSVRKHGSTPEFPAGSATWHWSAPMPIPSYLVLTMVGDYKLTSRLGNDGLRYYEAYDTHISDGQLRKNLPRMHQQPDITAFESRFNGPFPFSSDGVVSAAATHGAFIEEMESMIVFNYRYVNLSTLYHENMHQWWGDNVTESAYNMTFFKEGMATLGQVLERAREAAAGSDAAGVSPASAFDKALVTWFNKVYGAGDSFWTQAPSKPHAYNLFSGSATYARPGAAYVALWQVLGRSRFIAALHAIQRIYAGSSITEPQLERQFARFLPTRTPACEQRLHRFFSQWFDTAYRGGGGSQRPHLTGPGLDGGGFYGGACPQP